MTLDFKPLSQGLGLSHLPPVDPPRPQTRKPLPQGSPNVSSGVFSDAAATTLPVSPAMEFVAPAPIVAGTKDWVLLSRRIGAFSIDTLFNVSLLSVLFAATMFRFGPRLWDLLSVELGVVLGVIFALASWALVLLQEILFKTSLGKWIFRLRLGGPRVSIFVRAFFFPLSVLAGGLGLLWSLWDPRGRCWHDMLADLEPQFK